MTEPTHTNPPDTVSAAPFAAQLRPLARLAVGRSGADIERMVREARLKARRAGQKLAWNDLVQVLRGGGLDRPEPVRWRMAVHEAGHALVHLKVGTGRIAVISIEAEQGGIVRIEPERGSWLVRTGDGELNADRVILAVPPATAEALLPPGALTAVPGWSVRLGTAPIVNVHVVCGERVLDEPFVAVVGSPVQWIFDRTEQSGLGSGQYLALSLSAADEYIDAPVAALRELFLPELSRVLPALERAQVRDFFVTREREATFRPAPGQAAWRAGPRTGMPGLYLAGAWTDTGWPATMEGAVRSGDTAARVALADAAAREEAVR